jgi:hypothetical protein
MDAVQDSQDKKEIKEEKVQKVLADDDQPEYQEKIMFLVSTSAQGFILVWCLLVLSLGYVKLPTRMFGMDIPDQPRIDSTFAAGLLGNILAGWGISVGANNGNKKKKKEESESNGAMPTGNGGYTTIIVKQPLEVTAKPAEVQRVDPITNRPIGGDGKLA